MAKSGVNRLKLVEQSKKVKIPDPDRKASGRGRLNLKKKK